jgi:hypothetical protein
MDLREFVELGLLHEVNRQFFHPLGLALAVAFDEDTGNPVGLVGVVDCRDDPAGILFTEPDPGKIERVRQLRAERHAMREERLGFVVQPVDSSQ